MVANVLGPKEFEVCDTSYTDDTYSKSGTTICYLVFQAGEY